MYSEVIYLHLIFSKVSYSYRLPILLLDVDPFLCIYKNS